MMRRLAFGLALGLCLTVGAGAQTLRDLDGRLHSIPEMVAQKDTDAVVLVIWCSQCGSCRGNERPLAEYAQKMGPRVKVYAVDPHPGDTPDRIRRFLKGQGIKLDVLRDANQALISAFKINRTTTALVYDKQGKLRYLGPFRGDGKGYAGDAVEEVLAGREVSMKSRPLNGCPIPRL